MVVATMSEDRVHVQRGLSEWWSEESECFRQRIERWAALARGYNRLRSQKFSKDSVDDVFGEDENHYIQKSCDLKRSDRMRARTSDETRKLNCCGGFNYQSNSKLDSNCLETYRYDHSIYFKTIGDIRRSKSREDIGCQDGEKVEWDVRVISNSLASRTLDHQMVVMPNGEVCWNSLDQAPAHDPDNNRVNVWPIVQLCDLDTSGEHSDPVETSGDHQNHTDRSDDERNNNATFVSSKSSVEMKPQHNMTRILSSRTRRSPKFVRRPMICGDNNVSWPGVLLTYTTNYVDPAVASAHNRVVKVK